MASREGLVRHALPIFALVLFFVASTLPSSAEPSMSVTQGVPLVMATYGEDGTQAGAGSGISMSGNLRGQDLDVSALPSQWYMSIGGQLKGSELVAAVGMYRGKYNHFVIDQSGIVYPDGHRGKAKDGPYIDIDFHAEGDKQKNLIFKRSQIDIRTINGQRLPIELAQDGTVTLRRVPANTITIDIALDSGSNWEFKLFPYVRGSIQNVVDFDIYNLPTSSASPQ